MRHKHSCAICFESRDCDKADCASLERVPCPDHANLSSPHMYAYCAFKPACDVCKLFSTNKPFEDKLAHVDGRMKTGVWANMCREHWKELGCGKLGQGYGQMWVVRALRKATAS